MTLLPPQGSEYREAIEVMAQEIKPPDSEPPIQWLLLTNCEVTTLEERVMACLDLKPSGSDYKEVRILCSRLMRKLRQIYRIMGNDVA